MSQRYYPVRVDLPPIHPLIMEDLAYQVLTPAGRPGEYQLVGRGGRPTLLATDFRQYLAQEGITYNEKDIDFQPPVEKIDLGEECKVSTLNPKEQREFLRTLRLEHRTG